MPSTALALSVVLATRNRARSLEAALARMRALSPGLDWELIVVDNGSSDDTAQVLARTASERLRALHEPLPGKGRALNRGIAAARGELLAFSDDDVEPEAGWLDELAGAALRHPQADVFGGRIVVEADAVPGWIRRSRNLQEILITEHDLGDRERPYPPNRFPHGPNMAVRRRALEGVAAPWATDLGPGCSVPVGDERSFFCRIGQGGGKARIYVPTAIVRHHPPAHQLRFVPALRRCYWGGYSGGLLRARHPESMEPESRAPAWALLARTRSLQELACVAVRAVGYLNGRREGKGRR
jgi:hypothetical protein